MITAAERRAKIEKLKRDREIKDAEKKKREEEKLQQEDSKKTSNDLISEILKKTSASKEKQLMEGVQLSARGEEANDDDTGKPMRSALRVASYVVQIEITPKKRPTTYEVAIQCDIVDPKSQRLGAISEESEYNNWQDDFDNRYENRMHGVNMGKESMSRKSTSVKTGLMEKTRGEFGKVCPKCQTE